MTNTLFYGDNLLVLREHVADASVNLVYLDPPFNSNASYNVLFREKTGEESPAQIKAFTDTWEWTQETQATYEQDIIQNPAVPSAVKDMISAFRQFIGQNAMMAYLVMMAPRLVELHRVLKPTGSLYLHCDPTASHYLKILLDAVFGKENFRNELVWKRTNAHKMPCKEPNISVGSTTSFLRYSKGNQVTFLTLETQLMKGYVQNGSQDRTKDRYGNMETGRNTFRGKRTDLGMPDPTRGDIGLLRMEGKPIPTTDWTTQQVLDF